MSRISYPQLVKNIADAYREATNTTEAIAISELAQKVADAMENGGGESVSYMSIIYNEDNSLTMIESDGTEHTMTLTHDDTGRVVSTTLDGKSSKITYDDDGNLTRINKTELDMSKVPEKNTPLGNSDFNIIYSEEEPSDTSKLWIKEKEPPHIYVNKNIGGVGTSELASSSLSDYVCQTTGALVGNKIYVFNVGTATESTIKNVINVYDIETDSVSVLDTTLPVGLIDVCCGVVGTRIYIIGGRSGFYNTDICKTIYEYDTVTGEITLWDSTLTSEAAGHYCEVVGTKIYVFGGETNTGYYCNSDIQVLDTETKTVSLLSSRLSGTGYYAAACTLYNDKIYMFGGGRSKRAVSDCIKVFDLNTTSVTVLDVVLPTGLIYATSILYKGKIYIFGGQVSSGTYYNKVLVFDPESHTIEEFSSDTIDGTFCGSVVVSKGLDVYSLGGRHLSGSASSLIAKFSFTHPLEEGSIEIDCDLFNNQFSLIKTDTTELTLGIKNIYVGDENNQARVAEAYLYKDNSWTRI